MQPQPYRFPLFLDYENPYPLEVVALFYLIKPPLGGRRPLQNALQRLLSSL